MNICSEILSEDGINSFNYSACNDTEDDNDIKMVLVLDIMILLSSFPMNSYVIWLIVTGTGNGLAAEFFNLNFSVCEIFLCMESLCGILSVYMNVSRVEKFLEGLAITGRPLFQCVICVERYLAVIHPVTFLKCKPLRYKMICSVIAWITGFSSCLINFMTSLLSLHWLYTIFWAGQFFIFLSIQLFCCAAVLRALKQSGPGEREREREREREEENNMKKRAFHLILITTVTTVIIYAPYITLTILEEIFEKFSDIFQTIGNVCFLFVGFVQPLLFLFRVGKRNFLK